MHSVHCGPPQPNLRLHQFNRLPSFPACASAVECESYPARNTLLPSVGPSTLARLASGVSARNLYQQQRSKIALRVGRPILAAAGFQAASCGTTTSPLKTGCSQNRPPYTLAYHLSRTLKIPRGQPTRAACRDLPRHSQLCFRAG
jgi:hypothetical protein